MRFIASDYQFTFPTATTMSSPYISTNDFDNIPTLTLTPPYGVSFHFSQTENGQTVKNQSSFIFEIGMSWFGCKNNGIFSVGHRFSFSESLIKVGANYPFAQPFYIVT